MAGHNKMVWLLMVATTVATMVVPTKSQQPQMTAIPNPILQSPLPMPVLFEPTKVFDLALFFLNIFRISPPPIPMVVPRPPPLTSPSRVFETPTPSPLPLEVARPPPEPTTSFTASPKFTPPTSSPGLQVSRPPPGPSPGLIRRPPPEPGTNPTTSPMFDPVTLSPEEDIPSPGLQVSRPSPDPITNPTVSPKPPSTPENDMPVIASPPPVFQTPRLPPPKNEAPPTPEEDTSPPTED